MKTHCCFIFFVFLLGAFGSYAQKSDFILYQFPDKTVIKAAGKEMSAKMGMPLEKNGEIILPARSTVVLICKHFNSYKYTEKQLLVNGLKDTCRKESTSMTASYFKYVWHEFAHGHGGGKSRMEYMKNTGGVSRGDTLSCPYLSYAKGMDKLLYNDGSFPLSWKSGIAPDKLTIQVYDDAFNTRILYSGYTHGYSYNIKDIAAQLKTPGTYFWGVAEGKQTPCFLNELVIVSEKEIKETLLSLMNAADETDEATRAFRLGFALEEQRYLPLAYEYYKKAATGAPDNELYKQVLTSFEKSYNILP